MTIAVLNPTHTQKHIKYSTLLISQHSGQSASHFSLLESANEHNIRSALWFLNSNDHTGLLLLITSVWENMTPEWEWKEKAWLNALQVVGVCACLCQCVCVCVWCVLNPLIWLYSTTRLAAHLDWHRNPGDNPPWNSGPDMSVIHCPHRQ